MKKKMSNKKEEKLMEKMRKIVYEFYRRFPKTTVKLARE
jgi:hypothetical protein